MIKLNSTTAILLDLDGVILDIEYDIKFWESWLPEHMARKLNLSEEEAKSEILTKIEIEVIILDQHIDVPEHSNISSIKEISSNSLVSIMYPQKEEFSSELTEFCFKNNCVIYYPWS